MPSTTASHDGPTSRAHLRKQRSVTRRAEQAWEDPAESLELALLKKERDRQLYQALRQLRDEYRQVLLLLYFEGMTPEEAGHVLGKGRKQIYNLAQRSRQALRTELERMGFDHAQY